MDFNIGLFWAHRFHILFISWKRHTKTLFKNNLLSNLNLFNYTLNNNSTDFIPKNSDYDEIIQTIDLVSKINISPLIKHSKIEIFSHGIQKFESLKKELINAKHHIHMEYFIVRDDHIGNEIKDILIKNLKRA